MNTLFLLLLDEDDYVFQCLEMQQQDLQQLPKSLSVNRTLYEAVYHGMSQGNHYRCLGGDVEQVEPESLAHVKRVALLEIKGKVDNAVANLVYNGVSTPIKFTVQDLQFLAIAAALNEKFITSGGIILHPGQTRDAAAFLLNKRTVLMTHHTTYSDLIKRARNAHDIEKHVKNLKQAIGEPV